MPKLKVYRTPIGFHDAYVAAPSQKAALQAWGAEADLFARGAAELVTNPELSRTPLDHPGEVIRLPRGSEAQHLKALGKQSPPPRQRKPNAGKPKQPDASSAPAAPPPKPRRTRPRPSRAALDKAERALRDAEARHEAERAALAERKRALELEQRETRARQAQEIERLTAVTKDAGAAFRARLEAWAAEEE